MILTSAKLRKVRSFDDVLAFLTDELDWPIETGNLEDATFDYEPEELGVPAERVPQLVSLRQLRPLTTNQPWGIFFIEFTGPRLPLTPLRRLLQKLVEKKRALGDGDQKTWQLDDLLFIITTDSGDAVELHFLAFFDAGEPTVEIRSIPWRPTQSPGRHLSRLADELLPRLVWPDDPQATDKWRMQWREAFKLRHGEAIRSAQRLAERMAQTATDLREQIGDATVDEHGKGPLSQLLDEVRRELLADVDEARFADMCAQTLVYGVLSSRVTDPIGFGASPTLSSVPLSNPFLASFFEQVHDQAIDIDLEGSGLEQLVADLRATNVEAILDQFGSTAKGGDPVIHFYEEFLKQYDRKMRADAGAFYTPLPVVSFMVRSVDEILRARFGLEMGIADSATWKEVANRNGFDVPDGVEADHPFVSMVDPATGTGTFLVEWLRQARRSFEASECSGDWPTYLREHVLPSMHAFELMLGPYAIAHLKVALELHDEGIQDGEATILLTDSLEHSPHQGQFDTMKDPVAIEGEIAADLKSSERFTVVIGNPPYDREQRDVGDSGKRKGGVVRFGDAGITPLLDDILQPLSEAGLAGHHARSVYNDYVYFWRWAIWQATELPPGPGVVAFITASSFLNGVSMGGLRALMAERFDEVFVVDLGGDSRGSIAEENVFDIRTPVAICFGVKTGPRGNGTDSAIRYVRVRGSRMEKFDALRRLSILGQELAPIERSDALAPFALSELVASEGSSPLLSQLMPWAARGIQFSRTWPVSETEQVLKRRWKTMASAHRSSRNELLKESRDAQVTSTYRSFFSGRELPALSRIQPSDRPDRIDRILFRSFDYQYCIADRRVIDMPRPALWRSWSPGQIYLVTLVGQEFGPGPLLFASSVVPDLNAFNNRGGLVLPVWRDRNRQEPNLARGLIDAIQKLIGRTIGPEGLAKYIYGLLATPLSQEHRASLCSRDGPRVPITLDGALFERAVALGADLLWWHTGGRFAAYSGTLTDLPAGSATELQPVQGYPTDFSFDPDSEHLIVGTGVFGPVSEDVWNFEVSGLRVLQSWLGYRMAVRKGKKSSPLDDIRPSRWTFSEELLRLISILEHTIEVTPVAADLLHEIVNGPLIGADELPTPTDSERKPPSSGPSKSGGGVVDLDDYRQSAASTESEHLLEVAESEAPRYDSKPARRAQPSSQPRERADVICAIRQVFGDGAERDRDTAIHDVAELLGYERVGSRIRETIDHCIRASVRRAILANDNGNLSLAARSISDYERDFLKDQFLASLDGSRWLERVDAIRKFARWMGFRRTGSTIDDTTRSLIKGLIREDRLESDRSLIRKTK